jgi:surfeit locus 1 family protein
MKRYLFPILLGVVGVAVLVSLGVWQLQRLAWKEALLAEIEARIATEPVALPSTVSPETDAYLAVRLTGRVETPGLPVFGTWRGAGAGYRIVAPFVAGDRRLLVDLGVAASADVALPEAEITIEGNLHWPEESEPDPGAAIWTNLDLPAMADRLGTEPTLIVAREIEGVSPPATLVPLGTEGIPNSHLGYAIQWFGLAAVWAGMTAFLLWRIHTRMEDREA